MTMTPEDFRVSPGSAAIVTEWLQGMGVMCDCDNGWRTDHVKEGVMPQADGLPCDRCVLVEVGGARVRAVKDWLTASANMILPGVEVDDERPERGNRMNPDDGNIYDAEQAKKLGLEFDNLVALTDEEAEDALTLRRKEAEIRRRRKAVRRLDE